jgi:hypothetical protein
MVQLLYDCSLFNNVVNNSGYVVLNDTIGNNKDTYKISQNNRGTHCQKGHSDNSTDLYELQQTTLNNKNKNYTISTENLNGGLVKHLSKTF